MCLISPLSLRASRLVSPLNISDSGSIPCRRAAWIYGWLPGQTYLILSRKSHALTGLGMSPLHRGSWGPPGLRSASRNVWSWSWALDAFGSMFWPISRPSWAAQRWGHPQIDILAAWASGSFWEVVWWSWIIFCFACFICPWLPLENVPIFAGKGGSTGTLIVSCRNCVQALFSCLFKGLLPRGRTGWHLDAGSNFCSFSSRKKGFCSPFLHIVSFAVTNYSWDPQAFGFCPSDTWSPSENACWDPFLSWAWPRNLSGSLTRWAWKKIWIEGPSPWSMPWD